MKQYIDLIKKVYLYGTDRPNRTGVEARSLFGETIRCDEVNRDFPLLTTKKLHYKSIVEELLWFLRGEDNVSSLHDRGVTIWDEWADTLGYLGPIYGVQWRGTGEYKGVDQIKELIKGLRTDPFDRRHLVSAWNVRQLQDMALPPCHYAFQCYVRKGNGGTFLDLLVNQRSCDLFLGVPFNLASYATLMHLLGYWCDMTPGTLIWNGGDVHLYSNHQMQYMEQMQRAPKELPMLELQGMVPFDRLHLLEYSNFVLHDYAPWPHIPAPVAV